MWCDQKQFLLITNNRASMPVHLSDHLAEGEHCPGIFILSPKMSLGGLLDELELIWQATEPADYQDLTWHLPLT